MLWATLSTNAPTIYTCCPQYIQVLYILWVHYPCHPQYVPTIYTNTHNVYPQYIHLYILWVYIAGASRIYCGCDIVVYIVGAVQFYRWVTAFVNLLWHVDQQTNRTKVYLNGLGRLNCVNAELMSFQHLRSMIAKGVPRMVIGTPRLQNWTYNHVLTISYMWIHQIGSLKRAKVVIISKLCFVTHIWPLDNMKFVSKMIKIMSKWWKFVHRSCVWDIHTV